MATTLNSDTIGPVDVAVIEFPGNQFNGDVAPAIKDLVDSGTIHIVDLAFVTKDSDGSTGILEITSEVLAALEGLADDQVELLSDEDLEGFAAELDPNSSALVVVWENTWASRFSAAVRGSGGHLAYFQRIPHEVVEIAIEALNEGEAL